MNGSTTRPERPISLVQATKEFPITYKTLYRYTRTGRLRSWRMGEKLLFVDHADLERLFSLVEA